ncbi:hypothetical protein ACFL5G_03005 [Candidatus Margulisiibacteriota bacterium]
MFKKILPYIKGPSIKNHLNEKVDLFIGAKTVAIGPRKAPGLSKKDLTKNNRLSSLTSRSSLKVKPEKDETANPDKKDKGKKKDK